MSAACISQHSVHIFAEALQCSPHLQQLLQTLKDGTMEIAELPLPIPGKGEVLVRTHFSAISAGTEGKTVSDARKGYIAKARARKDEVAKVVRLAQRQGAVSTYKMVMNRLEALQPLGYSISGVVLEVGDDVREFKPGDRVACGGASASHAEVVVVPENLCVKIPENAAIDEAAFTTIGAIALQGIRRAELSLGENCVVIGLGLLGQLTMHLLRAAGVRTFGVDLRPELIALSLESGAEDACLRSEETIEARISEFTGGFGADAVIIAAATISLDPVDFAGLISRKRGKVVIVGNVPTGFNRKNYYQKELDLRMSSSYGPGRYDARYEEQGLDYPIGHVRWTENRNMQAFAQLLGSNNFSIKGLISHCFPFAKATEAFDVVLNPDVDKMGILLAYDVGKPLAKNVEIARTRVNPVEAISFIGAGSFASNFLLPEIKKHLTLSGVVTSRPHTAEDARRKFGFKTALTDLGELLGPAHAGAVIIATRHNTHASLAMQALQAGKRVFVEKPLCTSVNEYFAIKRLLSTNGTPDLMVGFNRRFAPFITEIKSLFVNTPLSINYRINAGKVAADHWVHDPLVGGGRIIGEVCHFVDLCAFLTGSKVESVSAQALSASPQQQDTFAASLRFENGSVAVISYFSNGSSAAGKERIEVNAGGSTAVIEDFKSLTIYGRKTRTTKGNQDKGHASEMRQVASALREGRPFPLSVAESLHATIATFALQASITEAGRLIAIIPYEQSWTLPQAN